MTTTSLNSQPPPLTRSATDRKLLGVCAGFAERYGLDPLVVRIAVVVLALFGGLGVVLYLVGAALLPEHGETGDLFTGSRLPWTIVAGLALLVAVPGFVFSSEGFGFLLVAGLIALIVVLVRRPPVAGPVYPPPNAGPSYPPPQPSTLYPDAAEPVDPAADAPAADAPFADADAAVYGSTPYPPQPYYVAAAVEPLPPRPRSYLGAIVLGIAAIWTGLAWSLNAAGITSVSAVTVFGVALAILGGGILVGAWVGRARWLVLFALPLALVTWGIAAIPDEVRQARPADWVADGVGDAIFAPTEANPDSFRLGAGSARLNVGDWAAVPASDRSIEASVGLGELIIYVPDSWDVVVNADVAFGAIERDGTTVAEGSDLAERIVIEAPDAGRPAAAADQQVQVDADVRLGEISIVTVASGGPEVRPTPTPAQSDQSVTN